MNADYLGIRCSIIPNTAFIKKKPLHFFTELMSTSVARRQRERDECFPCRTCPEFARSP